MGFSDTNLNSIVLTDNFVAVLHNHDIERKRNLCTDVRFARVDETIWYATAYRRTPIGCTHQQTGTAHSVRTLGPSPFETRIKPRA